jgi:hypothetical protein
MMEYLQTKRSEMAKTNTRHSHRLVLGLVLVGKLSLHGFSGLAETSQPSEKG